MNNQTKLAIVSIMVVIPLVSIIFYNTNARQEYVIYDNSRLQVISSFSPLYEFSQIVGGDRADISLLVSAGVAPHDWAPTVRDVQQMQRSDLIIINGIGFENWVDRLSESNYQGTIVDTSMGIPIKNTDDGSRDPHIWLNPVFAKKQVQNIALAFSDADPKNTKFYRANADLYTDQLDLLDSRIRTELSGCNRDFVAFHKAFSYFSQEYDLNEYTILPTNNFHGQVTAKTLEDIILTAKRLDIHVIFSEERLSSKSSNIIAEEIGGKVLSLSSLETYDETYVSKMTENLENLKEALCR